MRCTAAWATPPKFPRSLELDFLFHYYHLVHEAPVLEKLAFTLEKMARGGIYDQLGGGFHRYSVDAAWMVPHFEKMLYDNALLPPLYLAHYQLTGSALSRRIATETLDFILRDMLAPDRGFYAAWDADSEGVEGKYYVWSLEEVERVVGPEAAPLVTAALGVTREGNFEGANILTRPLSRAELAARFDLAPDEGGAPSGGQPWRSLTRCGASGYRPTGMKRSSSPGMVWRSRPWPRGPRSWETGAILRPRPGPPGFCCRTCSRTIRSTGSGRPGRGQRPGFLGGLRPLRQRPPGPLRDRF